MRLFRSVLALLVVFPIAWMIGPVGADDAEVQAPPPPLDLATVLLRDLPPGFTQLPDQAGRIGRLDAGAAAAVLDQSGRVQAAMLTESGFRAGYSRAWAKNDTQDVVVDVLLEFHSDRDAQVFTRGFLSGRKDTTKSFDLGIPEASGFERGPATPSRATPAQREVVMRRGRVLAIVVLAGFASYPSPDTARALAQAQAASLAPVPVTSDPDEGEDKDRKRAALLALAALCLTGVAWWMVHTVNRNPVVGGLPPAF